MHIYTTSTQIHKHTHTPTLVHVCVGGWDGYEPIKWDQFTMYIHTVAVCEGGTEGDTGRV